MKVNKKFFVLLLLSGSLILPSCDLPMPSAVSKSSSDEQLSESQPEDSSDNTTSSTSNPDDNQGAFEVSANEWDGIFVRNSLFDKSSNVTLSQQIKLDGVVSQNNLIQNNNGNYHMLFEEVGKEKNEFFLELQADSTVTYYGRDDNGEWEKANMPASFVSEFNSTFATFIPPMQYSSFTYDETAHAYKLANAILMIGRDQVEVSNVEIKFENKKLLSIQYEATADGVTGSVSVIASQYGTTAFSFPTVNTQGGNGEAPDENLFSNSVFRYQELKECQLYSDKVSVGLIQGYMGTSEIYLFEDGEFEMFYKDAQGLRYVVLGSYSVPQSDKANLVTRSLYNDKDQAYSFNIPTLYANFTLSYVKDNNTYEMGLYFLDDQGTALAKVTIVFAKATDKPVHLDLPQEPVNDKWSVSKDVWDNIFNNASYINRSTNLTITHSFGSQENVLAFDSSKVYSKVTYDPAYGLGASEIYLKLLNDALNKVDYYEYDKTNQIWTVRQNIDYAFANMVMDDLGIKAFAFTSATYNSVGHYYAIRKFTEYPYGEEAGYSVDYTEIKIFFENNQLQKITFKDNVNQTHTYLYTQYGSTVINLPQVGTAPVLEELFATKAYKFDSYTNSNSAFDISSYVETLTNDEIRFFHDTTDYTFEWLLNNRSYDGTDGNSIVLCGKYTVKRSSSSYYEYQYYISLNVKNVYVNGMELDKDIDGGLFETLTIYYFEADSKMCYREDDVPCGTNDYTNIKLYFKEVNGTAWHFDLPRLDDNWSQYDVIMAMSQIGVMNDNLPNMHYVKTFTISTIDTTNKSFDIICVMPSEFFVKHVFEPYKKALQSQYRYTVEYNSNREIISAISPNAEFKITFEVKNKVEVIFHIENYVASIPEADYPTSAIAGYIRANNITDTIPEFKVQGATRYEAYGENDYMSVTIYLDANLIDNAITSLIKLLTDLDYVTSNVGETVVYTSKNNQVSIVIMPYKEYGAISVMLMEPIANSINAEYPSTAQNTYLQGVTDTVPNFDHVDGEKYMSYGPEEDSISFNAVVYLKQDSTADVESIVAAFEKSLVDDYGYEKLLVSIEGAYVTNKGFYVSKNKQVAIAFEYSKPDKGYAIEFINLTLYPDAVFLGENAPIALSVSDYKSEFEIGDEFIFGDDAVAYVTLADGREIEVALTDLSFKPVTFTASGSYEIEVSYTADGVTASTTLYVWVAEQKPELEDYVLTIQNIAELGDIESANIYAIAYGSVSGVDDENWPAVYYDVDNQTLTVEEVDNQASSIVVFIETESTTYIATVRLIKGQLTYSVTFSVNEAEIGD